MEVSVLPVWSPEGFATPDPIKKLLLTQSLQPQSPKIQTATVDRAVDAAMIWVRKPQAAIIQTETQVSSPQQTMSPEMEWLTSHAAELSVYAGEWLLIAGRALVAHSPDFRKIHAIVRERGITEPFLYYVPTPEEANFVL